MTTLPVAILAGGLATRLGTITETIPKALLDVGGTPFILHQLALLRKHGVRHVVLCVAHLGEQIEAVVGDGRDVGLEVDYSHDGGELLGTGGALRRARILLGNEFLVLYGDSYLQCDYAAISNAFLDSDKLGLMTVYRNDGRYDASNVAVDRTALPFGSAAGRGQAPTVDSVRVVRYDKTPGVPGLTHIDWGLGAFRSEAFAGYPEGRLDLARVYQDLLANDQLFGYEVRQRFYEIGSVAGLEDTRRLLSPKDPP